MYKTFRTLSLLLLILFAACSPDETKVAPDSTATVITAGPTLTEPTPTSTPQPTATPIPLAALVNGEGLPLSVFQAELARLQGSGTELATKPVEEASQIVLDDLINQALLAQAATAAGFTIDAATLQSRIDKLATGLGSSQALDEWMTAHHYTLEEFRQSLQRSVAAAWMRDQIVAAIPEAVDQVHARQILLYNSKEAQDVLGLLQSGQDFARLALTYDPVAGGDLGWFPKGYLTRKPVEEAAFALQPGQYSQVIQTDLGYHLIQVIERDAQHPLAPDARLILQEQALGEWLQQKRAQSDIQIRIP